MRGGEEGRRRGGEEDRRRGGEEESSSGGGGGRRIEGGAEGILVAMRTGFNGYHECVVAIYKRVFKRYVHFRGHAVSRRLCHSDVQTHAHSNSK